MNRKYNCYLTALLLVIFLQTSLAQEESKFFLARQYFNSLDSLLSIDDGRLWGKSLKGHVLFVDQETREVMANQPDQGGAFLEENEVFLGQLPEQINIANTSLDWNGQKWTVIMWSAIPDGDFYGRNKLFIHESWHSIQNDLPIEAVVSSNTYLDEVKGNCLMKLEFLALQKALWSADTTDQIMHLRNALTIRTYRQALFTTNNENAFEQHEGSAEYTGFKLCGLDQAVARKVVAIQMEKFLYSESLTQSFAYLTGPAYGYLYDGLILDWREQLVSGLSFADIGHAYLAKMDMSVKHEVGESDIDQLIVLYEAQPLLDEIQANYQLQADLSVQYRKRFLDGSQLIIPNNNLNFRYNPQEKMVTIGDKGVVYHTMRITGEWGILEVTDGIFRTNDWTVFVVEAPLKIEENLVSGTGYVLKLKQNWNVQEIKEGKFTLRMIN